MGNYKSSAGNFKITILTASNKFHWAMWLAGILLVDSTYVHSSGDNDVSFVVF